MEFVKIKNPRLITSVLICLIKVYSILNFKNYKLKQNVLAKLVKEAPTEVIVFYT